MTKYNVIALEESGATPVIDVIEADDNYTAEQYIEDCRSNGVEWGVDVRLEKASEQ